MSIHVVQSHNISTLLEAMLKSGSAPSENVFEVLKTQNLIVPNRAMEKWVSQKTAEINGISGNCKFYSRIQSFQWDAYQLVLDNKDFVRQANMPMVIIKWRICEALKQFIAKDKLKMHPTHELFPIIERIYQSADSISDQKDAFSQRQKMLYWVADQTARLFTNYMNYRGQCNIHSYSDCGCSGNWLAKWGQNKPLDLHKLMGTFQEVNEEDPAYVQAKQLETWQRWLWVNVFASDFNKIIEVDRQFWEVLGNQKTQATALSRLPDQLTVFTLLELPPQQLNFLRRLGQFIDVVVFHYNPSQEYWADSVDARWKKQYDLGIKERFIEQNRAKGKTVTDSEIKQWFEEFSANFNAESRESRHPLLTRLGKQARDQFSLLSTFSSGEEGMWIDIFPETKKEHLLGRLQTDILNLLEPIQNDYELHADDETIKINVCHSSLRQLEILKDEMLKWLADGTEENPRNIDDILVLTPNIKNLEPLIRSVFSAVPKKGTESVYLPAKITGIVQSHIMKSWESILGRLLLIHGRFQYEDFADWLSLSATQIHYDIDYASVERMLEMLKEAGFKRSFDEVHALANTSSSDADVRFSFKYALDRLMLGVAIDDRTQFDGVLSFPDLSFGDFELVSKLLKIHADFDERRHHAEKNNNSRSSEDWFRFMMSEVNEYQESGIKGLNDASDAIQSLLRPLTLQAVQDARTNATNGALVNLSLPLKYVIDEITTVLESKLDAAEPSGHITFAQIGHIRPIPYRLVVMLNMDSGVFPTHSSNIPFDLMRMLPASLGDRSRCDDEHGAFLDGLLMAQDGFWIYFNGFDIDSGLPRQPSSIVQELIDHIALICNTGSSTAEYEKINEIELQKHIISLFNMHQLQPFDPKGFTEKARQLKSQWYEVARKIHSGECAVQPWADIVYTTEKKVEKLNAEQWINQMIFPAELYLNAIDVRNVKAQDMMPEFEPLIIGGLEKYALKDQIYSNGTEQDAVQDLLPVGKLKDVIWKRLNSEYQQCLERLSRITAEQAEEQVVEYTVADDLKLNITVPVGATSHWAKIKTSSGYGDHRTKVWLEYLLWLSHLNLGDSGRDYRLSVVFSDITVECNGLTSDEAREALSKWYQAWRYGRTQPLVMPAKLMMSLAEKNKALTWEFSEEAGCWELNEMETLVNSWTETFEFSDSYKFTENKANRKHRDWAYILRNQNPVDALKLSCARFSYDLYQLIFLHQKVI